MIKRTIEISQQPVHLTVRDQQLLLLRKDDPPKRLPAEPEGLLAAIPCEDIGLLLVEHPGTTYTHAALVTLLNYDAAVVICGRNHLPAGLLLPFGEHTQVVWRIHDQLAVKKPLAKQLWRQIVQAKIRAQAANLPDGSAVRRKLLALAREVRSADPTNVEAQAARAYWQALFEGVGQASLPVSQPFRRDPDGDGLNALLNYGYAVVRAAIARAIVSAGLVPALGIHHANRGNAFCLADDLVEPLRPLVDARVKGLADGGCIELNPQTKPELLSVLTTEVRVADQTGPLMVALHRMVASLVRCYEGAATRLDIPVACESGGAGPPRPASGTASADQSPSGSEGPSDPNPDREGADQPAPPRTQE
jgi:CRISPR-associated protein Cas1